jgi:hypothetical protein
MSNISSELTLQEVRLKILLRFFFFFYLAAMLLYLLPAINRNTRIFKTLPIH